MGTRRLTARFVSNLSTAKDREDWADALVEGLQLRVTRKGAKTWSLRYRRHSDNRRRRIRLGTYPEISLEEARNRAREELGKIARGADPASGVKERKQAPTFRELTEDWFCRHAEPNKTSRALSDDRSMLELHILPEIGDIKSTELTRRHIISLLDKVSAKSDARSKSKDRRRLTHRPNRVFELVRSIFRWAVGRDLVTFDPTVGLSPPIKKEPPRERVLSPEEIVVFWQALGRAPRDRYESAQVADAIPMRLPTALALKLALVTAQRIGEVTGIEWTEIDLNDLAPTWTIPGTRSKNGRPNRVPLSPLAVEIIREARSLSEGSRWLFPNPKGDGPMKAHAPTKALGRSRGQIGIEDLRVHDLRRTAATHMAELGISPHTISLLLNHVSARSGTITARVYVQYSYDREKREALERWGARISEALSPHKIKKVVEFLSQQA